MSDAYASGNPAIVQDAALRIISPQQYERDRVLGRLPSQVAQKAAEKAERKRKEAKLFAGLSAARRSQLAAGIRERKGLDTWRQIQAETAAEIAQAAGTRRAMPHPELAEQATQAEYDTAAAPVAKRPRPRRHVSLIPLKEYQLAALVRAAPTLERIDLRLIKLMAGTSGAIARDVAGVDPATRTYHAEPGETPAGIAKKLTGSADRVPDLLVANPGHTKDDTVWRIPPGWLQFEQSDDTGAISTQRKYVVVKGDSPIAIAEKLGAQATHPKWWSELKQANPDKKTTSDGKNWLTLWAGEEIGIPDAWPPHALAVPNGSVPGKPSPVPPGVPNPGPFPPTFPLPAPANSTTDPGVMLQAQGMLALFAVQHSDACNPPDFGHSTVDFTGTTTPRTVQAIQSFQIWWNKMHLSSPLRTDGVLDDATYKALHSATVSTIPVPPSAPAPAPNPGEQPKPAPQGGIPIPVPQAQTPAPPAPQTPGLPPGATPGQQVPGLPPGWTWTNPTGPYGLPWQAPTPPAPQTPGGATPGQQVPGLPPGWTWTNPTGPYGLPWQAPTPPAPGTPPESPNKPEESSKSSLGAALPIGLLAAALALA